MTELDQPFLDFPENDPAPRGVRARDVRRPRGPREGRPAPREWKIGDPLWFSRVQLDRRDPEFSRIVGDAQMMKSWVIKPFGDTARDQNGMLYSVEIVNDTVVIVYVQSHTEQNWWWTANVPNCTVSEPKRIDQQVDNLPAGGKYNFRVAVAAHEDVADPEGRTRIDRDGTKRTLTRRRHLALPQQQVRWLTHRLDGAARIEYITGTVTGDVVGIQRNVEDQPADNEIAFKQTIISGRLTVLDPAALAMIRRRGIGPEKAYGCGLLHLIAMRG